MAVVPLIFFPGLLITIISSEYWLFAATAIVLFTIAAVSFFSPRYLLYFVVLSSASAGLLGALDTVQIAGTQISLSGLRWIVVLLVALAVLVFRIHDWKFLKQYWLFHAFTIWVVVRWLIGPVRIPSGTKDILFYSLPPIIGVLTMAVGSKEISRRVEFLLLNGLWIPIAAYIALIPLGFITFTEFGPIGVMEPRSAAAFLLIVECLAIANWRYRSKKGSFVEILLIIATILFTLSRISTVMAVMLLPFRYLNPRRMLRSMSLMFGGLFLVGAIIYFVPTFQQRFLVGDQGFLRDEFPYINMEGREIFWPVTVASALESPVTGWGPGTARVLVGESLPHPEDLLGLQDSSGEYPPHNEYLQVFNDTGAVGLSILLAAFILIARRHWNLWRQLDGTQFRNEATIALAAFLGLFVILVQSFVDNTLHYTYVCAPVFILSALATKLAMPVLAVNDKNT